MAQDCVIGFGGPRRPNDVQRMTTEKRCQFLPGLIERRLGARADPMGSGWIADGFRAWLEPGLLRLRQQGRGGVMVEVTAVILHRKEVNRGLPVFRAVFCRSEHSVAADVRRRVSAATRVPPPHVGSYVLWAAS